VTSVADSAGGADGAGGSDSAGGTDGAGVIDRAARDGCPGETHGAEQPAGWQLLDRWPALARFREPSTRNGFGGKWRRAALPVLWLLVPISNMVSAHPSTLKLVLVGLGVLAFVLIYIVGSLGGLLKPIPGFVVLVAFGVPLTLLGTPTFSILFIYAGAAAGVRLGRWAPAGVVLCTILTAALSWAAGAELGYSLPTAAVTLSIGAMMLAFGRLIAANIELERARHELARLAVNDERMRFARDLHDLLGHSLSVIALKAELAGRLLGEDPDAAAVHVRELEGVARQALVEVRETVSGYRRPVLAAELDGARMALRAAGIDATLERSEVPLEPDVEALMAWAVREGTINVIRHSGARSCRVVIVPGLAATSVEVLDDGCGPGTREADHAAHAHDTGGNGLAGLRERAESMAGRLEAGLGPNGGFRLCVTVPSGRPGVTV
jgi:two-component system sensor histidine kinase DesK